MGNARARTQRISIFRTVTARIVWHNSKLATAAVMALGQIGTPKAKAALLEIIEKKEPETVKKDLPE